MTETDYKHARENFDQHCAERELAKISTRVNPSGTYYKFLLRQIEAKYGVKL